MKKRKDIKDLRENIERICEFANELDLLKLTCGGDKEVYKIYKKNLKKVTKIKKQTKDAICQ